MSRKRSADPVLAEYVTARLEALGVAPSKTHNDEARQPPADARAAAAEPTGEPEHGESPDEPAGGWVRAVTRAPAFVRAHFAVVVSVVVVGIAITGYIVTQSRATSEAVGVSSATTVESATVTATASPGQTSPEETPATIQVHVLGAVAKPGVVTISSGSRVADAIEAAGGLTSKANPAELNLAALVPDGAQIVVGSKSSPRGEVRTDSAPASAAASSSGSQTAQSLVNINTATAQQLEELPGIGPVTAAKIIQWREDNGAFTAVEDLLDVSGIGDKTLAELAPHVQV